ncbi:hypothetical protein BDV96DRAFT_601206 [Lophiotrema nucula]|uniref:Uncharacterized protein n=1 Tax=Lophiotrema nucula TaxID=690887 RepID=A0A6A5Z2P3_9PLEO|nr:hypothetical protein BDV96DRAFT_601206 [Lophiotrema nucula]
MYQNSRSPPPLPPSRDAKSISDLDESAIVGKPVHTLNLPDRIRPHVGLLGEAKRAYTGHEGGKPRYRIRQYVVRNCAVFVVTVAVFVILALVLSVLVKKDNEKSGIVTLRFNLTSNLTAGLFSKDQSIAPRAFFDDPESLIDAAKSAIGPAASKVKSAASSVSTSLQGTLEKTIPKNLSLGTQKFCVGFVDNITCKGLPLNLSDLLPDTVENLPRPFGDAIRDEVHNLQPIADALSNIMFVRILLIL